MSAVIDSCGTVPYLHAWFLLQLESTTDFLRDHVWEGEKISNFVRKTFFPSSIVFSTAHHSTTRTLSRILGRRRWGG